MTAFAARATRTAAILACALAALPGAAGASAASDALRPAIEKVLRILDDPELKGETKMLERRAALRDVVEGVIDFPEAARRALAVHWRGRTDAEHDEFVVVFKDLATHSYIRLMEPYAGGSVQIAGESQADDTTTVFTRVHRRQGEPVSVDYRMHLRGTRWLIYDVLVEGVSLVGNYRVQFNTIIQTSSYPELLRRMRARVIDLTESRDTAIGDGDVWSRLIGAVWRGLHGQRS